MDCSHLELEPMTYTVINDSLLYEMDYFEEHFSKSPERDLLSSVLRRAVADLFEAEYRESVINWLNGEDDNEDDLAYLFSFKRICLELDFDADTLRKQLISMEKPLGSLRGRKSNL